MNSAFRMGWMMVCFDLPTVDKQEQRQANRFRQGLLELGFFMLQESIYVRSCVSMERYPKHMASVESIAPDEGLINVFFLTDKQWGDSKTLFCTPKTPKFRRQIDAGEPVPQQMTFW